MRIIDIFKNISSIDALGFLVFIKWRPAQKGDSIFTIDTLKTFLIFDQDKEKIRQIEGFIEKSVTLNMWLFFRQIDVHSRHQYNFASNKKSIILNEDRRSFVQVTACLVASLWSRHLGRWQQQPSNVKFCDHQLFCNL